MADVRSDDLITVADAAERLGCTVQHVRLLCRRGVIAGAKLGRDWLIVRSTLAECAAQPKPRAARVAETRTQYALFAPEPGSVVNVASVPQRSPFRYPGGKTWLIPTARRWLASLPQRPATLVEPFAGGGGIGLMAAFERLAERSVLVELDPAVASVWRCVIYGDSEALCKRIEAFPCNLEAVRDELATEPASEEHMAFQTILRNRVSRGGILAPGAGLVKTGEANRGIASRWYPETLARRIRAIVTERDRLDFVHGDGMTVIDGFADDAACALFIDPPYLKAGRRLYTHHELDHEELFAKLARSRGTFLATYDHCDEIVDLARRSGFQWALIPMKSTHHACKHELVIGRDLRWLSASP